VRILHTELGCAYDAQISAEKRRIKQKQIARKHHRSVTEVTGLSVRNNQAICSNRRSTVEPADGLKMDQEPDGGVTPRKPHDSIIKF